LEEDQRIADRVRGARQRLLQVRVSPETLSSAVQLAAAVGSTGHRGEVALVKAARAFAALSNSSVVERTHLKDAARLVLPHRMPRSLAETMEDVGRRLESALEQAGGGGQGGRERGESGGPVESVHDVSENDFSWDDEDSIQVEGAAAAGSIVFDFLKKKSNGSTNRTKD
jgi:Mg-chelatase subunit ChlI